MSDLRALLALQDDDLAIHVLEQRLAALEPRIRELDTRRQRIVDTMERQSTALQAEEKKQAFLRDKIAEHRELIARNQAQLDAVKTMRQATAAAAQMDQAKRIVAGEESDLHVITRRVEELRAGRAASTADLEACEAEQATARGEVATERASIDGELAVARATRDETAKAVPAGLRSRYDRIRNAKLRCKCSECRLAIAATRNDQVHWERCWRSA